MNIEANSSTKSLRKIQCKVNSEKKAKHLLTILHLKQAAN